jgi:hypothetical protein
MITSSDRASYAQLGWLERASNVRHTFKEYLQGSTYVHRELDPFPLGQADVYQVDTLTPGQVKYYVDGNPYFASDSLGFTPLGGQIYGEIFTKASQMPGGYNSAEIFSNDHIYYSGIWNPFAGQNFNGGSSIFQNIRDSDYQTRIWDWACP